MDTVSGRAVPDGLSQAEPASHDIFWGKAAVGAPEDCWPWQRSLRDGYGVYWNGKKNVAAHRFAYSIACGSLQDGLVIDHLCRNRACINPNHLRQVTNRQNLVENSEAAAAAGVAKTHCKRGHELSGANLRFNSSGTRRCRTCDAAWNREYRARRKEQAHV